MVGWAVCLFVCVLPSKRRERCSGRVKKEIQEDYSLPPSTAFPFTPTRYSKTNRNSNCMQSASPTTTTTPNKSMYKDNQAQRYLSWTKNAIQVKTFLVHTNTFSGTQTCAHTYNMPKDLQLTHKHMHIYNTERHNCISIQK